MSINPKSATLIQGVFPPEFFDVLKKRQPEQVVVTEGRPSLRSSQNSCHELIRREITPTVIADNMAGFLFARGLVKEVWVTYRVANNKEVLCEIGALILTVLASRHKVPVYGYSSVAPTVYLGKPEELFQFNNTRVAARGIRAYVPLWEWVPRQHLKKIYEHTTG